MLIELCNNYVISDGLVNGADGLFKATTSCNNKSYIWIKKINSKIGITTRFSNSHLYKELDIESTWTPIEALAKETKIEKNQTHLVTQIQFPIQLAAARTIHRSQGLSLDDVVFNPCGVTKHGLAYTALSRIRTKEKLYLLTPLTTSNFQVETSVLDKMKILISNSRWNLSIPILKTIRRSHTIIQSINMNSLQKHHLDYKSDHSMQTSHILCFQETKINQANNIGKYIDTSRYNYIHNYDKHGILMIYERQMICASYQTRVNNSSEFIAASFNLGTRNAIYVIIVYRAHSTKITLFLENLDQLIIEVPIECPIVILGDFNIDVSKDTTQYYEMEKILNYIKKHKLKQQITTPTTKKNSLIDHIWSNIPRIDTQYGVTDAYWPDYHKPIYCAFKLPNTLPQYVRHTKAFRFI
jgi:exonuclease III